MNDRRSFGLLAVVTLLVAAAAGLGLAAVLWAGSSPSGVPARAAVGAGGKASASPSHPSAQHRTKPITLRTSTSHASPGQRVDLIGQARSGGVSLRVQERDGGRWSDFPATGLTRSDGTFESYVLFGQPGPHILRMTAPGTGQVSNPVRVIIG